jgi:hypothetical protein
VSTFVFSTASGPSQDAGRALLIFALVAYLAVVLRTACYLSSTPIPRFPLAAAISGACYLVSCVIWRVLASVLSYHGEHGAASLVDLLFLPMTFATNGGIFARVFQVSLRRGLWISFLSLVVALVGGLGIACVVLIARCFL